MLGTARYASPEQAQGEALDGKADVYSLALVLVEAVTGQVPFAADTTDRHADGPRRPRPGGPAPSSARCARRSPGPGAPTRPTGSTPPTSPSR